MHANNQKGVNCETFDGIQTIGQIETAMDKAKKSEDYNEMLNAMSKVNS